MLKVKFWRIENVVLMKVLECSKNNKCYNDDFTNIKISFGCDYYIDVYATGTNIYINTKNNNDINRIISHDFSSVDDAIDFYNRAVLTIKSYNKLISPETSKNVEVEFESTIAE